MSNSMFLRNIPRNKNELKNSTKNVYNKTRNYFPTYKLRPANAVPIMPDERLPWGPTVLLAFQHVLAMFGSTVLGPLLMGFSPNTALLFSGVGTIIFFLCTGGRVPSYLGSSFAFIGVVNSATGYIYQPGVNAANPHVAYASGGIMVCGFVYLAISLIIMVTGSGWLEYLTPPVVTGSVVIAIGLHLSQSAINQAATTGFDAWMALLTVISIILCTCYAPGPLRRLPILVGGSFAYLVYFLFGLGGIGPGIDYTVVSHSKWVGAPPTTLPKFDGSYISLIAPVAVILAAENIGHLKAVSTMTDRNMDGLLGRTFLGDSIATIIASLFGGVGVTSYAENIGVMSITKIFSTLSFLIAAVIAFILGFLPIFGAVVQTIPPGIFGGLSIVLFGITALTGAKLYISAQVDFSKPRNLLTAGISIVIGVGMIDVVVQWGNIKIDGIGCATFSAIILYQLLRDDWGKLFSKLYSRITRKNNQNQTPGGQYENQQNEQTDSQINNKLQHQSNNSTSVDMTDFVNTNTPKGLNDIDNVSIEN